MEADAEGARPEVLHSHSVPESTTSWQDSSFEDSVCSVQPPHDNNSQSVSSSKQQVGFHSDHTGGLAKHAKHKLDALKASTDMLFHSGRDENKRQKAVFGVIAGFGIGGILLVLLVDSFGYTHLQAGIIAGISTIIICVGLALSSICRCIMALVLPNFFTGKGRAVFLSVIFGVMLAGPVGNITHNAKETGSSMACVLDVVTEQSKSLQSTLAESAKSIAKSVDEKRERLEEIKKMMTLDFDSITSGLKTLKEELSPFTAQLNTLYEECRKPLASAVNTCTNICNTIPSFLSDTKSQCLSKCSELNKLSDSCKPFSIEDELDRTTIFAKLQLEEIKNYFKADVKIEGDFSAESNSSKSVKTIQNEVNDDIETHANSFKITWEIVKKALSLSLFLLFLQAFWYFRNYMAKDGHDNMYITKQFKQLDKEKETNGEETVLPLKKKETADYIFTSSPKLNTMELGYSRFGLAQVLLHALLCIVLVFFDYVVYYILNLVNKFVNFELNLGSHGRLKVSVEGKGPIAQYYREMFGMDFESHYSSRIKIEGCLPKPKYPDEKYIAIFIFLYLLTLVFVILRGYGMRLRRKIAAYYYPEQESARLEYLHKTIRHRRNAYRRFLRQEVKSTHKESVMKEKFRLSTWLVSHIPCTVRCVAARAPLECTSCGEREGKFNHIRLTKCTGTREGVSCTAVYCDECQATLRYICPLCSGENVELRE